MLGSYALKALEAQGVESASYEKPTSLRFRPDQVTPRATSYPPKQVPR